MHADSMGGERVRRGGWHALAPRAQDMGNLKPCIGPLGDLKPSIGPLRHSLHSSVGGVPGHVGLQAAIWPGLTRTASDP